jgi:hypothetical protein
MGSLLVWPPRIPHTQYSLLVQCPGSAPYVLVKRYNDFRTLHMKAEQVGLYKCLHKCLYKCLHTYMHTCMHTCLHTCLHKLNPVDP